MGSTSIGEKRGRRSILEEPCPPRMAALGGENPSWVCITSPGYCHAIQISPEEQRKLAAEAAAHSDWRLAMLD